MGVGDVQLLVATGEYQFDPDSMDYNSCWKLFGSFPCMFSDI